VQKVPALLNDMHWLMENRSFRFALCGSSGGRSGGAPQTCSEGMVRRLPAFSRLLDVLPLSDTEAVNFSNHRG